MTRKSSTTLDVKPRKAILYTPVAWFIDRRAGKGDGDAAIPDVPAGSAETADASAATSPYIEVRRRHFLDRAEREHRHMLKDLEPVHHQLAGVRQDIAGGEEQVTEIHKRLGAIREPDEAALTQRNAVEQHIPDSLVRARRQREHDDRRGRVQAELDQALARLRGLRVEEARITRMILTREQILATRVGQLHEHTLRRCATYKHHLVRRHPDGQALIPFLDLALPALPDWLPRHNLDTDHLPGPRRPPRLAA
jgi:hypothetical protein